MRLTEAEVSAIVNSIEEFIEPGFSGTLKLFGSRTDDTKFGGDIDLALIVNSDEWADKFKKTDFKIVAAIKMKNEISDQKIDFKILNRADAQKSFFVEALKDAILLKNWE